MKFTKLRESVRRGLKPNTILHVPKSYKTHDNKRNWIKIFVDDKNYLNNFYDSEPIKLKICKGENTNEIQI